MIHANTKGFTLVELMLAMTFISVLILSIALTVMQVSGIYYKGMTLKEVNQAGRDISNDLRRTLSAQQEIDPATDYVEVTDGTNRIGGRLCVGKVTYLWNYGEALQKGSSTLLLRSSAGTGNNFVRLGKIDDPTRSYCVKDATTGAIAKKAIPSSELSRFNAVLGDGSGNLNVYKLDRPIAPTQAYDPATGQRLYTLNFTIGSGDYGTMMPDFSKCKEPGILGADLQYCMVEQFSIVVRAGNKGESGTSS